MKRHAALVLLLAAGAVLTFGLVDLLMVRFEEGDVYPAYSSLRADPIGTMAFYESLERISGMTVRRDYSTENKLPAGPSTVYLHLAGEPEAWERLPKETMLEIERYVGAGGRLAIALYPGFFVDEAFEPKKPKPPESPEEKEAKAKTVALKDRWGVEIKLQPLPRGEGGRYEGVAVRRVAGPGLLKNLPEETMWHSGLVLSFSGTAGVAGSAWRPVYVRDSGPVVAERGFGKGSIVFATDSFFLSNEALRQDRNPELLTWLIGANREVVFDEAHLGVTESPGIATLIRRYRLHGLLAALALLAALFIWKNAFSLLPRRAPAAAGRIVGRDAASGFVNLLRRSVKPNDLLAVCFSEWKALTPSSNVYSAARLARAEAVFQEEALKAGKDRDPVQAYKKIAAILNNKRNP